MKLTALTGTDLEVKSLTESNQQRLLRSMILQDERGRIWGVPAGHKGKESIPGIFPETASGDAGGLPHDFMYTYGFLFLWDSASGLWTRHPVTRAFADEFYRATCVAYHGYRWWAFTKKWIGLRAPGALAWHKHRRAGKVWAGAEPTICFPGGVHPCPAGSAS